MTNCDGEKLNNLIIAVANGNADSLDGIYELAGKRMYAVAAGIVGRDKAEDVLQDSFIKIARFAGKYKNGTNPYGWLLRIVRNTALDVVRAEKPTASTEEFFNLTSIDYSPEKLENAVMLEQALNKLPPLERKVIYFTYYLDMTVREAAAELKTSKSSIQRTLERAQQNLKILLDSGTNDD